MTNFYGVLMTNVTSASNFTADLECGYDEEDKCLSSTVYAAIMFMLNA